MSSRRSLTPNNSEATLVEGIADLVRRYLTRPNRMHSYNGTIEWRIYSDNTVCIQVSIQPSHEQ